MRAHIPCNAQNDLFPVICRLYNHMYATKFHCLLNTAYRVPVRVIGFGMFEILVTPLCNCSCETQRVCDKHNMSTLVLLIYVK